MGNQSLQIGQFKQGTLLAVCTFKRAVKDHFEINKSAMKALLLRCTNGRSRCRLDQKLVLTKTAMRR